MSSEDFRESSLSQKVRKPSELITGGGVPEPPGITHGHPSLSVIRLSASAQGVASLDIYKVTSLLQ